MHSAMYTNLQQVNSILPLPSCVTCVLPSPVPHCRLRDCLQNFIPDCNDNNVQDLEERLNDFPEVILVEHAVHMWHITVRHHHDLLQNASSAHL